MKKIELLSPVGNKEMLYQAIHNGADAVYLSGTNYGARKFAHNFNREEIKEAIEYAHLYGVLVYVTVNTIIYEDEINECLEYIKYLEKIGVDALIMQDIGLIDLVRKTLPSIVIHASTQMHNYSKDTVKFLKELGVKRVVFARETSINEIKKVENMETEVFIHGALCVSYSGCCLFSSLVGSRSGNRGECAGSCRLKYNLYKNDKKVDTEGEYLLSTKELCTIDDIDEILSSGVDSLKIEGRMKSPEYVGFVTALYRKIIDNYYKGKHYKITSDDIRNLKVLYNREFTKGFILGEDSKNIVNVKSPNHQGIVIGEVIDFNKDMIKIELTDTLNQNDGIRFLSNNKGLICNYLYDSKGKLISSSNDIVYIKNNGLVNDKSKVLKTYDSKLKDEIMNVKEKKVNISFCVKAKVGCNLEVSISDGNNNLSLEYKKVELAKKRSTSKEDIGSKLGKLGNTCFNCTDISFDIDENIFIPISYINEVRRILVERLSNVRMHPNNKIKSGKYISNNLKKESNGFNISFLVRNEKQLRICLDYNISNIYVDDYKLYKKYIEHKNIYYYVPRVNSHIKFSNDRLVVSDTASMINNYSNNILLGSCYLNAVNSYSINYLFKYVDKICLSLESDYDNDKKILSDYKKRYGYVPNIEKVIYGRADLMIMKYCPLKKLVNKEKNCRICLSNDKYYLEDRMNKFYPILQNNCITTLLHYKNIDNLEKIDDYKKIGISNFLIILYDENETKIKNIINSII